MPVVTSQHLQSARELGCTDPRVFIDEQPKALATQLSIVREHPFSMRVDNTSGWWTPVNDLPMALAWVDSADWARIDDSCSINLHGIGKLRKLIPLWEDFAMDRAVVLGELEHLPKYAEMTTYDIGDRVIITSGPYQGPIVYTVANLDAQGWFCGLSGGGPTAVGTRSVRTTCLGAVLDRGWEPTVPGRLRYPAGTQLRVVGAHSADEHLMVMGWRDGRAQVVNIDNDERHLMTKTAIAAALARDAAPRPVS